MKVDIEYVKTLNQGNLVRGKLIDEWTDEFMNISITELFCESDIKNAIEMITKNKCRCKGREKPPKR